MNKILIVGGGGYLGSVIASQMIIENQVEILDCCFFGTDGIDTVQCYETHKMSILNFEDFQNYDRVIWCCDNDIPEFYYEQATQDYIKRYKEKFEEACQKSKLIYITSFEVNQDPEKANSGLTKYIMFLQEMQAIAVKHEQSVVILGNLYGPSPRMRWDTCVNSMIFNLITQNGIMLGQKWMDKISVISVLDAANYIKDMEHPCNVSVYTEHASLVEIANKLNVYFSRKDSYVHAVGSPDENPSCQDGSAMKFTCGLEQVVKLFELNIEKAYLPDFKNDIYNNKKTVMNFLNSIEFYRGLKI